jgi:hypothetical protein
MTYLAGTVEASISTVEESNVVGCGLADMLQNIVEGFASPRDRNPSAYNKEHSLGLEGCAIVRSCKSDRGKKSCRCSRAITHQVPGKRGIGEVEASTHVSGYPTRT